MSDRLHEHVITLHDLADQLHHDLGAPSVMPTDELRQRFGFIRSQFDFIRAEASRDLTEYETKLFLETDTILSDIATDEADVLVAKTDLLQDLRDLVSWMLPG